MTPLSLNRRHVLAGLGASLAAPRLAFAATAETDRRLLFIIQRGAADGIGILAPTGDPAWSKVRGGMVEDMASGTRLDTMFTLHPALAGMAQLYAAKQALFVPAVGIPYRDRSHFDAQNVLETGGTLPYQHADGWLNRLLALMPGGTRAMAIGPTIPAALRGAAPVTSYGNSKLPDASEALMQRVSQLYAGDAQLHSLWDNAMQARSMAGMSEDNGQNAIATGKLAARLLSGQEGARVAMIESDGWDTHVNQRGRLNTLLKGLDGMIGALKDGLGPVWDKTMVVVATEFGRTVAPNGTGGTDHGTGSLAMMLGGAVNGGKVLGDWPGLAPAQMFEGRDLRPTTPVGDVLAGAAAAHFGIDPARVLAACFPGTGGKVMEGLARV